MASYATVNQEFEQYNVGVMLKLNMPKGIANFSS